MPSWLELGWALQDGKQSSGRACQQKQTREKDKLAHWVQIPLLHPCRILLRKKREWTCSILFPSFLPSFPGAWPTDTASEPAQWQLASLKTVSHLLNDRCSINSKENLKIQLPWIPSGQMVIYSFNAQLRLRTPNGGPPKGQRSLALLEAGGRWAVEILPESEWCLYC